MRSDKPRTNWKLLPYIICDFITGCTVDFSDKNIKFFREISYPIKYTIIFWWKWYFLEVWYLSFIYLNIDVCVINMVGSAHWFDKFSVEHRFA